MPTSVPSASTRPPIIPAPTRVSRLWAQLPTSVRTSLLQVLSQILARQWQEAARLQEADQDNSQETGGRL